MRTLFSNVVWGQSYVDDLLNISLASQATPGNLGAAGDGSVMLIATEERFMPQIANSAVFKKIKKWMDVEFDVISERDLRKFSASRYGVLTHFQNKALDRSRDFECVFFGYADALWGESSYDAAYAKLNMGYDAVFSIGYRLNKGKVIEAIASMRSADGSLEGLSRRKHANIMYGSLAKGWSDLIVRDNIVRQHSTLVMWPVDEDGLVVHGFHQHPVAIYTANRNASFFELFPLTLDEGLVARFEEEDMDIYISPSTDEIAMSSLYENDLDVDEGKSSILSVRQFSARIERFASITHRELLLQGTRMVVKDGDEAVWAKVEAQAMRFVMRAFVKTLLPTPLVKREGYGIFERRKEHYRFSSFSFLSFLSSAGYRSYWRRKFTKISFTRISNKICNIAMFEIIAKVLLLRLSDKSKGIIKSHLYYNRFVSRTRGVKDADEN